MSTPLGAPAQEEDLQIICPTRSSPSRPIASGCRLVCFRAVRSISEELLLAEPGAFDGVTADAMAAVSLSWIHGCAVQAMIDPRHFDTDEYLAAVRGFTARVA